MSQHKYYLCISEPDCGKGCKLYSTFISVLTKQTLQNNKIIQSSKVHAAKITRYSYIYKF